MADNVNIIVQDTINDIVVNAAVVVETIDINVQSNVEEVQIIANPNNYVVNINQGGGGGSQTLEETLEFGNNTGGTDILINDADAILLENNASLKKGTFDFGQDGGISRFCSVDYEDMWQGGIRHVFDNNGFIRNSTNCFNAVPNFSFDVTLRFKVGSIWTLDDGTNYICTDNTEGAAVWELYNVIPTATSDLTNDGSDGINPFITAADIPPVTGFVPYTGATSNVDLGTHTLSAKDLVINHSSGSGVAASITKGGAGEALTINKTSGSGNAMSVTGGVTQLSELHLTTDLADAYIASAATWNGKFTLPALTSGSVLFSDGTTIAQDNANLFWDDTNNRLGIGTNAPTYNLDILSTGTPVFRLKRGTTTELRFSCFSGGAYIGTYNSSPLIFTTNSTDRATIFANGNFAIGTTTDAGFKLDVNGTARVLGNITVSTGGTGTNTLNGNINSITANQNNFSGAINLTTASNQPTGILISTSLNNNATLNSLGITSTASISSGSQAFTNINLIPTLNFTGTYSGIVRGLYYNPTLTSLTGVTLRAIETVAGNVLLGTTSGSVGIGANTSINASAIVDITSTTKGFLPPRMTTTQKNAIATPAAGLMVYDTTLNLISVYNGTMWISL